MRWHRKGFRAFWRWKSRPLGGRPQIDKEVRDLIRKMSVETRSSGRAAYPRRASEARLRRRRSTVSKYMVPRQGRPSQTWKTFLHNHADGIASIDLFVVPTIAFEQLFAFLILGHGRRQLLWFAVTRHPTAEWLARQITEAFPWNRAPTYIVRDNDRAFGSVFTAPHPGDGHSGSATSFRSPWQNGHVERLIGSIRRECTDHLIVLNEEHLRRFLRNSPPIIMGGVLMFRLGRIHRTGARSSVSETLSHMQSWADCITGTHEFSFWKRHRRHSRWHGLLVFLRATLASRFR